MASIFNQNKNYSELIETDYIDEYIPIESAESILAKDILSRALGAVASMQKTNAEIAPGETFPIPINPAAAALGAASLRTEIAMLPIPEGVSRPLLDGIVRTEKGKFASFRHIP